MKLVKIKPSKIKVPELRVTAKFDEETRQVLRDSIKEVGIIAPIIVQEIDGEIVLVDGLHRIEDAIASGDGPVDVAILDGDMVDLLCRNLFLDHARGKTPISDMVKVIGGLATEYGVDPDEIKKRTGLNRDYIERLIKISKAAPAVQEALDDGIIGVGIAFELSRLPYPAQQEEIIAKQQVYRFAVKDIKDLVDNTLREMKLLAEKPTEAPEPADRPAPVYHCEGCQEEIEARHLRAAMVCPNCFGEVFRLAQVRKAKDAAASDETPPP